ncbi:MAG: regulatory protein RecX [Chlamydiota bacterium]
MTKIVLKPKQPNVNEIFIGEELIGEYHNTIFGRTPDFHNIHNAEDFFLLELRLAKNYALKLLAKSAMPAQQLRQKLKNKHVSVATIDKIIAECNKYGYLNDQEWAASFVRCEQRKKHSKKIIALKLREKGISQDIITEVLPDDERQEVENILRLLKTSYRSRNLEDRHERHKVIAALLRKGFNHSAIEQVLEL